jgi:hypothetical protein
METVKRPYMRTAPVAIECRCDGSKVYALIGPNYAEGVVGFGDTLPDALRHLADEIEAEVGQANPYNLVMLEQLLQELERFYRTRELPTEGDMERLFAIMCAR